MATESRNEAILRAIIDGTGTSGLEPPQSRIEALLYELMDKIDQGGGGGGGNLVVPVFTFAGGKWSCDMTFAEVLSAIESNKCFFGTFKMGDSGETVRISGYGSDFIDFDKVNSLWGMTDVEGVQFYSYTYGEGDIVSTQQYNFKPT